MSGRGSWQFEWPKPEVFYGFFAVAVRGTTLLYRGLAGWVGSKETAAFA